MRSFIGKAFYLLVVELVAVYLIYTPVHALTSYSGYVRIVNPAAGQALWVANSVATRGALVTATMAPTLASTAIRLVTGPVGWAALSVTAGLAIYQAFYTPTELAAIKAEALASLPPTIKAPDSNYAFPTNEGYTTSKSGCEPYFAGCYQTVVVPNSRTVDVCAQIGQTPLTATPVGWSGTSVWPSGGPCRDSFQRQHWSAGTVAVAIAATAISAPQIDNWLGNVPDGWWGSPKNKTTPVGTQNAPTSADNTTSLPVTPTQANSSVVPSSQVGPGDSVLNPNAVPPSGAATKTTTTTAETTNTTTTTNPDGSTTKTETTEGGPFSCDNGNHDERSFGSILQAHIDKWSGSGLLSALNTLKTLVWPSSPPAYTLTSSTWGTHAIDFNAWSGVLLAIRAIIIALSSFVAYRIVFVGGR